MTDLRTLFAPGQACIPFDEGTLCLGCPDVDGLNNLITNGGFEYGVNPPNAADPCVPLPEDSNDITGWIVVQDGIDWIHEAYFTDPCDPCDGEITVALSGTATGKGGISQSLSTVPGNLYHVFFDLGANPYGNRVGDAGEKILNVSVTGDSEEFSFDSTNNVGPDPGQGNPWQVNWQKKTWSFIATDETTNLVFAGKDDPNTEYTVAIDNVIVHDANIFVPCDHVGTCWDPYECAGQRFGDGTCDGDVGVINLADLIILKMNWGKECPWDENACCADFNHDGAVNLGDLIILKMNWGRTGFTPSTGNQTCPN
jgi:choice-of-anchor C domain-containing protein